MSKICSRHPQSKFVRFGVFWEILVPRTRKTFSCCCRFFYCISRLSPTQEIRSKGTTKRHTFSCKIRLQIDPYECVLRSRNHNTLAQNLRQVSIFLFPKQTLWRASFRWICAPCMRAQNVYQLKKLEVWQNHSSDTCVLIHWGTRTPHRKPGSTHL